MASPQPGADDKPAAEDPLLLILMFALAGEPTDQHTLDALIARGWIGLNHVEDRGDKIRVTSRGYRALDGWRKRREERLG